MLRQPRRPTRTDPLFPVPTLVRSCRHASGATAGRPAQARLSPGSRAARAVSSGSGMVTLGDNRKAETTRAAASPFAARGSSAGEKLLGWVLPDVLDEIGRAHV